MTTEADIRELYSIKDDGEFKEKVIDVLYDLIGRIRDLESDIGGMVLKEYKDYK